MVVIGYIWKVAVNIVILFIVAWALDKLHERAEALVIPVLGIIYVTIRTTQGFQGLAMIDIAMRQQEQLDAIRSWIDGAYSPGDRSDERAIYKRWRAKFYIDACFLGLISLLCALTFFMHL
ncbi:hypothetical protein [Bradyrhizobium sp. STM 3566]|uniref:hypothetical protein n=1 Tax=Bradyrhizobium sp. STM 3566 TaxID=578928 RepID=UPI00388CFFFC